MTFVAFHVFIVLGQHFDESLSFSSLITLCSRENDRRCELIKSMVKRIPYLDCFDHVGPISGEKENPSYHIQGVVSSTII